ncbi:MAG: hypothetical protein KKH68_08430 [Proteobacteria bacterium]|nr:hypothetical protein [Pseudomonadota bacterium]
MKKESLNKIYMDHHVGCFGNFNIMDPICKKFCALSLRCAIDLDQNSKIELLEDLMFNDDLVMKIQ